MVAFVAAILLVGITAHSILTPATPSSLPSATKRTLPSSVEKQGITGNISMSMMERACANFVNGTQYIRPTQVPLTLTVTRSPGQMTIVPVDWRIYNECITVGTFSQDLVSGHYLLDLVDPSDPSWCHNLTPPPPGWISVSVCPQLPISVDVEPGIYAHVSIGYGPLR